VDPDAIISHVLARAGKTVVDAAVLYDAAQALSQIARPDLAAEYAARAYALALAEQDAKGAAQALTFMVRELGAEGRRALARL
jgi:hypothetical protein